MASEKQVRMLAARANKAGEKPDKEKLKEYRGFDNEDIDIELLRLAEKGGTAKTEEKQETVEQSAKNGKTPTTEGFSGNNFGMAAKAVINPTLGHIPEDREEIYIQRIITCYNLLQKARARIGPSGSGGSQ